MLFSTQYRYMFLFFSIINNARDTTKLMRVHVHPVITIIYKNKGATCDLKDVMECVASASCGKQFHTETVQKMIERRWCVQGVDIIEVMRNYSYLLGEQIHWEESRNNHV